MTRSQLLPRILIIFVLGGLLAFGIFYHEITTTETQAWLLARDASLGELLFHRMRYEGNPGLWHLLLMVPAKLGAPPWAGNLMGGMVTLLSAATLLFFSPLPLWLAALLPFTLFFSYFYGVEARTYGLLGFAILLLAGLHRDRYRRPRAYFACLAVLTLSSVHGALLGVVLAISYVYGLRATRGGVLAFARYLFAYAILLAMVALELWPASDAALSHASYETFNFNPVDIATLARWAMDKALVDQPVLSLASLLSLLLFFQLGRQLGLVLALLITVLLLFGMKGVQFWHVGILQLVLIFGTWISWESAAKRPRFLRAWIAIAAGPALAMNLIWAFDAFRYDRENLIGAAEEISAFLRENSGRLGRIYVYGGSTENFLPFLPQTTFSNLAPNPTYNTWQRGNVYARALPDPVPADADTVVLGEFYEGLRPALLQREPQLQGWHLERKWTVPTYQHGMVRLFDGYEVLTRRPLQADAKETGPLITAEIRVPPVLRSQIRPEAGLLAFQLVDAVHRGNPAFFQYGMLPVAAFPFHFALERKELEGYRNDLHAVDKLKNAKVSFRVFYCERGRTCRLGVSFGYIRQELTWNQAGAADLGPVYFQGYNPARMDCAADGGPLLAGEVRLDKEVGKRFTTRKFLLAVVANTWDERNQAYGYRFVHSEPIDLAVSGHFSVAREQVKLPEHASGRFLLYLLDPRGCGDMEATRCAEMLTNFRDDDLSRVIPLTTESLVTPMCGQTNLKLVGFYERDWATITIPQSLLR